MIKPSQELVFLGVKFFFHLAALTNKNFLIYKRLIKFIDTESEWIKKLCKDSFFKDIFKELEVKED